MENIIKFKIIDSNGIVLNESDTPNFLILYIQNYYYYDFKCITRCQDYREYTLTTFVIYVK